MFSMRLLAVIFLPVLLVTLQGCGYNCSGTRRTVTPSNMPSFQKLVVDSAIQAKVSVGPSTNVSLLVYDSHSGAITMHSENNVLTLKSNSWLKQGCAEATITVAAPLDQVWVYTGASVEIPNYGHPGGTVKYEVANAGRLTVDSGAYQRVEISASNGAQLNLGRLVAQSAVVTASGGAQVGGMMSNTLEASISSGAGLYTGVLNSTTGQCSSGAKVRILGNVTSTIQTSGGCDLATNLTSIDDVSFSFPSFVETSHHISRSSVTRSGRRVAVQTPTVADISPDGGVRIKARHSPASSLDVESDA